MIDTSIVTILATTATSFIDAFADPGTISNLAGSLTCTEADALVDLLTHLGAPVTGEIWAREHRGADATQGTDHHRAREE